MNQTRITRRHAIRLAAAASAASLAPWAARAQADWPSKAIRFVVPFAPGGSSEIVARATAAEMAKLLGQSVFVDNKPGGAGNVAMGEVARADDQHTVILGHIGTLAVNPFIFDKLPYDPAKAFRPISLLSKVPSLYVVRPDLPAKDLKEFIALAKAKPGSLNYGSAGNGSAGHLAMEYLKMASGTFMLHVPYRGTGPQLTDLMGGRLDGAAVGAPAVLQFIKTGKLRCIATGTSQRLGTTARCGHRRRTRLPGLRDDAVVRPAGTGLAAAGPRRQTGRSGGQGRQVAGGREAARKRSGAHRGQHQRGVRALHRAGAAALEAGDRAREDQAGLTAPRPPGHAPFVRRGAASPRWRSRSGPARSMRRASHQLRHPLVQPLADLARDRHGRLNRQQPRELGAHLLGADRFETLQRLKA